MPIFDVLPHYLYRFFVNIHLFCILYQQHVSNKLGLGLRKIVERSKNTCLDLSTGKQVCWKQVMTSWLGMKEHPQKSSDIHEGGWGKRGSPHDRIKYISARAQTLFTNTVSLQMSASCFYLMTVSIPTFLERGSLDCWSDINVPFQNVTLASEKLRGIIHHFMIIHRLENIIEKKRWLNNL